MVLSFNIMNSNTNSKKKLTVLDIGLYKDCFERIKGTPFELKTTELNYGNYVKCLTHAYGLALAVNLLEFRVFIRYHLIKNGKYNKYPGIFKMWIENGMIIGYSLSLYQLECLVRLKKIALNQKLYPDIVAFLDKHNDHPKDADSQYKLHIKHLERSSRFNSKCLPWNMFYVHINDLHYSDKFYITNKCHLIAVNKLINEIELYLVSNGVMPFIDIKNHIDDKIFGINVKLEITGEDTKESLSYPVYDDCAKSTMELLESEDIKIDHTTNVEALVHHLKHKLYDEFVEEIGYQCISSLKYMNIKINNNKEDLLRLVIRIKMIVYQEAAKKITMPITHKSDVYFLIRESKYRIFYECMEELKKFIDAKVLTVSDIVKRMKQANEVQIKEKVDKRKKELKKELRKKIAAKRRK